MIICNNKVTLIRSCFFSSKDGMCNKTDHCMHQSTIKDVCKTCKYVFLEGRGLCLECSNNYNDLYEKDIWLPPVGFPCKFWDDNSDEEVYNVRNRLFKNYYDGLYFDLNNFSYKNMEPLWPLIFVYCNIPKEYNYIAYDDCDMWHMYKEKPEYISDVEWNVRGKHFKDHFDFIPHPDPEHSLYSRDDLQKIIGG